MLDFITNLGAGFFSLTILLILLGCALYPLLPELPEEKDETTN